jgi:hypothetical protein
MLGRSKRDRSMIQVTTLILFFSSKDANLDKFRQSSAHDAMALGIMKVVEDVGRLKGSIVAGMNTELANAKA